MRIIDRIALNRLLILITDFILSIIKIFAPNKGEDNPQPEPKTERKKILPWRNRNKKS